MFWPFKETQQKKSQPEDKEKKWFQEATRYFFDTYQNLKRKVHLVLEGHVKLRM